MPNYCLDDAIDLQTKERHQRFALLVSEIFEQDWVLTGPDLKPERMLVAQDSAKGLSIARGHTQPMQATCVNTSLLPPKNYYAFSSSQPFRVVTAEQDACFNAGEVVILSNAQSCSLIAEREHQSTAFIIDASEFRRVIKQPERLLAKRLSADYEHYEPLRQTMKMAWELSEKNAFQTAAPYLLSCFLNQLLLIDLAFSSDSNTVASATGFHLSAAHQCRSDVKRLIDENAHQADFTLAVLARELALSPRYIQQCFAKVGETASGYLQRKRLLTAASMLRSHSMRELSITELAYACGFNSSAYFATEFKKCFGVPPRKFRFMDVSMSELAASP